MIKMTDTGEPASELERLIADLSESGQLIFVSGAGWGTRAPDRGGHTGVPRTGRPAVVARRPR